jgi:hypothetical protein
VCRGTDTVIRDPHVSVFDLSAYIIALLTFSLSSHIERLQLVPKLHDQDLGPSRLRAVECSPYFGFARTRVQPQSG